jgi:hypothetical protein
MKLSVLGVGSHWPTGGTFASLSKGQCEQAPTVVLHIFEWGLLVAILKAHKMLDLNSETMI